MRSVVPGTAAYARVAALYEEAFPPEELLDIGLLDELAELSEVDFTAYYEGDAFCGFSYSIDTGAYLYLVFLAVDSSMRSQGNGSRIIGRLKERFPGRVIILEIEPVDPQAANAAQRVRRLDFYRRCGFDLAGYDSIEGEMVYAVLVTPGDFDANALVDDVRRITNDAIHMELRPAMASLP